MKFVNFIEKIILKKWIKKNTKIYKEKNKKIMDKEKHMAIMVHMYT